MSRRSRRGFLALAGSAALGVGAYYVTGYVTSYVTGYAGRSPGSVGDRPAATPSRSGSPTRTPSRTPSPTSTQSPTPSPSPTLDRRALARDLDRYLAGRPGRLTVALHERVSGLRFRYRAGLRVFTASCVKVDILMALLLQAQADDRQLSGRQQTLAAQMIKVSDNRATDVLWRSIGARPGLVAANRRLGLRSTEPPATVYWANTLTSAADQVRLLESLVRGGSPLHTVRRRYVLGLMRDVVPEQRWGVSAAARDGDIVALKNGWFPTAFHHDLWVIDSIGRVRGPHRDLLIAVLSDHHPTSAAGIETVERVVELVAERLP